MNDINASERRLSAALDRIDYLLETTPVRSGAGDEGDGLQQQLDAALTENARLQEALSAPAQVLDNNAPTAESERLASLSDQAARLAEANEQLIAANRGLIEAAAGQGDAAEATAMALESEIEALRAARAAEIAQIADIMAELQRMLGASDAGDAPFAADVAVSGAAAELVSFGEEEAGFDGVYGDAGSDENLDGTENGGR